MPPTMGKQGLNDTYLIVATSDDSVRGEAKVGEVRWKVGFERKSRLKPGRPSDPPSQYQHHVWPESAYLLAKTSRERGLIARLGLEGYNERILGLQRLRKAWRPALTP